MPIVLSLGFVLSGPIWARQAKTPDTHSRQMRTPYKLCQLVLGIVQVTLESTSLG